jgi:hypothetical protein
MFPQLEKLIVRASTVRDPVHRLLQALESTISTADTDIACPLLSTLEISGGPDLKVLAGILKGRFEGGCKLRRLRLGNIPGLAEVIERSRVWEYVNELEIFNVDAEPRGMALPAVCSTDLGEWWQPWASPTSLL